MTWKPWESGNTDQMHDGLLLTTKSPMMDNASGSYFGPIKNVVLGIYDGPHATPQVASVGPVFLGIKNVTPEGKLDFSEVRHVSETEFPRWTKRVLPRKHDIVFSYEATLHRYAIIPEGLRCCLGRRMALVRPDQSKVDPNYLYYYFLSSHWRAQIESNTINGATVDRIPISRFPEFTLSLPPLPRQRTVSSLLSAYDDLIENNRRRIQLLEESARLLYKEWFVHLRFPGHEHTKIVDGMPEGWRDGVVSDFYNTASGGTPSRTNPDFYTGTIPWIKTQELNEGFIIETEENITEEGLKLSSSKLFPVHTVVVAMYGATIGQVGILSMEAATNQACCAIMPVAPGTSYAHAYLFFNHHKLDIKGLAQGAAQKNISQQIIKNFKMLLPAKTLLDQFSETVLPLFHQSEALQKTCSHLTQARDMLLPRLMKGNFFYGSK